MVDVFISYKREERASCERIYNKLKALGLDVWFDSKLTAGKSFDLEIEQVVMSAQAVMVLWSPDSTQSDWVREEARAGKTRDVLVAIKIKTCELPFGFGSTHYEDLHAEEFLDDDTAWLKILGRIGALTGRPGLADYSQALGRAASLLANCADKHPADPLADRMRHLASQLAAPADETTIVARPPPPARRTGPSLRWAEIELSLDPRDYSDFLEVYPQAEEAFEARRHRRKLEDWAQTDHADPAAVAAFIDAGSFAALEAAVHGVADALAAESDRARQQAFPVGSDASSSRAAAISKRSVLSRSFAIELAGLPDWPRPHMVAIPPGRFLMGSPDGEERWEGYDSEEEPRHEVQIGHVFALGRGPVTVDAFSAFINETGHDMGKSAFVLTGGKWINREGKGWRDPGFPQDGDHPATCLNWYDAQAFLAWLNGRSELTDRLDAYRLPSEAEWEYACRAGTQSPFGFGDTIATDQANFDGDTAYGGGTPSMVRRRATTRVGDFHANKIGLYDMHGNVWEWCQDAWNDGYDGAPADGTAWLTGDTSRRVLRGGSWYVAPQIARSAMRLWFSASGRGNGIGFRLARTLAPPATSP